LILRGSPDPRLVVDPGEDWERCVEELVGLCGGDVPAYLLKWHYDLALRLAVQRAPRHCFLLGFHMYQWPDGNSVQKRWIAVFKECHRTKNVFRSFEEGQVHFVPVMGQTITSASPGTTTTVTSPATWDNGCNSVEVVAGGSRGAIGAGTTTSGGGGGGAYTKIRNMPIAVPGTTQYFARPGAGSTVTNGAPGGDSWLTQSTVTSGTAFPVSSESGCGARASTGSAAATSAVGAIGGASSLAYASTAGTSSTATAGGTGGAAGASNASGGGGGGAGGPHGTSAAPGTGPSAGSAGDNGSGGSGGAAGSPGGTGGTDVDLGMGGNAVGSGGGGGGGNASASTGGAGGNYGGSGGGGGRSTGVGGNGAPGVVIASWRIKAEDVGFHQWPASVELIPLVTRMIPGAW